MLVLQGPCWSFEETVLENEEHNKPFNISAVGIIWYH
jgi:hypothetical protein